MTQKKISTFNKFNTEIKGIQITSKRVSRLLTVKRDLEKSYEWLFLFSVTLFESYLEEIFMLLIKWKLKWVYSSWIWLENDFIIEKNTTNKRIKELILWEKNWDYLEWIPYKKTIDRTKRYLKDWKPFTTLSDTDKYALYQIISLRNYIAHKSKESKTKLEEALWFKVLSIKHLLNKIHSKDSTYFDYFLINLWKISFLLQKDLKEHK